MEVGHPQRLQPHPGLRRGHRRHRRRRLRQGPHAGRARRPRGRRRSPTSSAPADVRARDQAGGRAAAGDAGGAVPHGHRGRRVRRHRRPRHPRGPHRGAGRRDRRRVRRRGPEHRAAARRRRAGQRPHADRRGQRPARRRAARGRLGHHRRPACFTELGHVPAEGEAVEVDGYRLAGRAGAGPAHRPGAHHRVDAPQRRPKTATEPDALRASSRSSAGPTSASPRCSTSILGTKVDDRLRQAADHPHPGAGRAHPARRPGRVRRHARHPQAPHRCSASGSTTPPPSAIGDVDVVCLVLDATAPDRPGRPVGGRAGCRRTPSSSSTRSTSPRPEQVVAPARGRPASSSWPSTSRCRPRPARASTSWSSTIVGRLPEGPQYYPDDMVTDVPEAFWVAELVREQLLPVDPRRAAALDRHPGHRVGVAAHPLRDPRRARLPEGDRDRQEGQRAQGGRHRRARAAARGRLPRAVRQGRQGLAGRPKALERLGY